MKKIEILMKSGRSFSFTARDSKLTYDSTTGDLVSYEFNLPEGMVPQYLNCQEVAAVLVAVERDER